MESVVLLVIIIMFVFLYTKKEQKDQENRKLKDNQMSLLMESCRNGNGESCFKIGQDYRSESSGYFIHDRCKALEYFKKGCDANNFMSCFSAGREYADPASLDYNINKAIEYYEKAIRIEGSWAIDDLAKLYLTQKKDPIKAAQILSEGCDKGEDFSCGRVIGFFEDFFNITEKDRNVILDYYNKKHPVKCHDCRFMKKYR